MKIRTTFPPLLILFVATLFATTHPSSAIAPDQGPSAFGQGGFTFFNGFRTESWNFSFDAIANKKGHARGRAIFDIGVNSIQTQVVVRIDCLDAQISSTSGSATLTGTVLHSDNPEFPKGANVLFGAVDFSGFPELRSDIITRMFVFEGDCHDGAFPLTFFFIGPDAITIQP